MKSEKKWYQKASNWVFIAICIILISILLINFSIMLQAQKNEEQVPSVFGYKPFIVLSGSMETEIHKGDMIITKIVDPKTLGIDDVIAFKDGDNTVTTHRIIDIVEKEGEVFFITKGDNNNAQDQNLVEYKDVEGIYVARIPGVGSIMNSLSKPTTIIIIAFGITIIFVISFAISSKKQREIEMQEFLEYKKKKEEEERGLSKKATTNSKKKQQKKS